MSPRSRLMLGRTGKNKPRDDPSARLFDDPDNPSEEDLLSNPKVAVSPVADQAEWIEKTLAGEVTGSGSGADSGTDMVAESGTMKVNDSARKMPASLWIILAGAVAFAGGAAWSFSCR